MHIILAPFRGLGLDSNRIVLYLYVQNKDVLKVKDKVSSQGMVLCFMGFSFS